MDVTGFVHAYYDALRAGEPLGRFFAEGADVVKLGVWGTLVGSDDVVDGLAAQTATTEGWAIESTALRATARDGFGWFHDEVHMGWNDIERAIRYEFQTRWTGTLEAVSDDPEALGWRFATMHVSVPAGGR